MIGSSGLTDSLMPLLVEADAAISVAHPDDKIAKKMAAEFGAVHVSWSAMYDTVAEYLFLTDPAIDIGQQGSRQLNPSILREHMTVIDVSRFPGESPLLDEARARGCVVIEPTEIYIQQLSMQFRAITGKDLPVEAFRDGLAN